MRRDEDEREEGGAEEEEDEEMRWQVKSIDGERGDILCVCVLLLGRPGGVLAEGQG